MIDPSLLPPLHDFLTVARRGSVGSAATALHKTPSAVSQQIRRLESSFGVALLERAGRGVRLTAAGEAMMGPVARLFDRAEAVYSMLGELAGTSTVTVRLTASEYLGSHLLAPVMRELRSGGAPLRFEIVTAHSADSVRLLERGEVDVAVVTSADTRQGLHERVLFEQGFLWVAPADESTGPRATVTSRLGQEPMLRLAPGSVGRSVLDAYLGDRGIRPASTIDVPSVTLLLSYAAAGVGIGLVPALSLVGASAPSVTREPAETPRLPVKLLVRQDYRPSAAMESFLARLVAVGGDLGKEVGRV